MCDVYALIEARRLLEKCTTDDVPVPVRRMLIHAQLKMDEEIEAYFKPPNGGNPCSHKADSPATVKP